MGRIIPDYEYDIFISYRQKDNKHDAWVTKFVENLRGELESTFKEDISIYFDANPHDRLQETHNVDKSLEGKLNCLIFIPILSQTYCDINSFAWQYEFLSFLKIAETDKIGKDVKLKNGNFASRILPVRIHDLEPEDIKLFENKTGSKLRSLDFVYKTASGVNRPLQSDEDRPNDNINKTLYRDQINKVAHAIKEIILGIKTSIKEEAPGRMNVQSEQSPVEEKITEAAKSASSVKGRLVPVLAILSLILVIAYLLYPKILSGDKFKSIRDEDGRISIAVMPFTNLTGDSTLNWFRTGVSSLIINGLGSSPELAVRDDQTMNEVTGNLDKVFTAGLSPSQAKKAAEKVSAVTYISGSFQGTGGKYRILANLVDTRSGDIICTNKVEGDLKSAGYLDLTDSLCREIKNYLEIKALEKNTDYDFRDAYPESAEAYKYFIEGVNLILSSDYVSAIKSLNKAIEIDSTFAFAAFYIAFANNFNGQMEQCRIWTDKAYRIKERLPSKYQNWLEMWYACFISKNQTDIIRYCNQLEKSGIESRLLWFDLGTTYYNFTDMFKKAIDAFRKVDEISQKRGDQWKFDRYYASYCEALLLADMPGEVQSIAERGLKINPENTWIPFYRCCSYVMLGDSVATEKGISDLRNIMKRENFSKSSVEWGIGYMYLTGRDTIRAEKYYRDAYNLDPEKINRISSLCEILIVSGINIAEGLELAEKGLAKKPDDVFLLWMKGLALHKSGKNEEALELLKKSEKNWTGYNKQIVKDIKEVEMAIAGK